MPNSTGPTNAALYDRDIAHLIHPLRDPALHADAKVWIKGEGAVLTDADGREFIDGLAGLWNVTGRPRTGRTGRYHARPGTDAHLRLCLQREFEPACDRAVRAAV